MVILKNFKYLKSAATNRIGVSQRKRGKEFGVAQSTIHSDLKKVALKYYKCQKASKYNKNQLEQVAKKCQKMRHQIAALNIFIIVDDEKNI